ncbi:MAG: hypothetical protein ACKVOJ_03940 [Sphingomonadaceae bacterium]
MSYDLLVFDPSVAPRDRHDFIAWWEEQAEWGEEHSYDDPKNTTPELSAWYEEMRKTFRNMNGSGSPSDDELMIPGVEDRLSDYSIGHHAIYVNFPWSEAEVAYPLVRDLAVKHRVGFYDASGDEGDGEIYFPGDTLRPPSQGKWREVSADFRSGDVSKYIPQDVPPEEPPKRRWFNIFRRDK